MLALEGEVERDFRLVREESQVLALAHEFGRDAVLAAWVDVQQARIETCKEVFGLRHLIGDAPIRGRAAVLLKKVVQILREATMFVVVGPVDESNPQVAALINEFGRDTVWLALAEVTRIRKDVFEAGPDLVTEAEHDPGMRLN